MNIKNIEDSIVSVMDFPKKGIDFKDITPIFYDIKKVKFVVNEFYKFCKKLDIDVVVAAESRGYLIGVPLAIKLKKPFVMVRKKGKLPRETISISYDLEYGNSILEIHKDAIKPGQKVVIVDDLIATGGTSLAIEELVKKMQGKVVAHAYLVELSKLLDKSKLDGEFFSLIKY